MADKTVRLTGASIRMATLRRRAKDSAGRLVDIPIRCDIGFG